MTCEKCGSELRLSALNMKGEAQRIEVEIACECGTGFGYVVQTVPTMTEDQRKWQVERGDPFGLEQIAEDQRVRDRRRAERRTNGLS